MTRLTAPLLSLFTILSLAAGPMGCSSCGEERERPARDGGHRGRKKHGPRDGGAEADKRPSRPEPRAVLPEARLGAVQGAVTLDSTTRVVIPRRRLVDGGVQVEMPDGGPVGRQTGRDGMELQIGDTVLTGADGSVDLELPDQQGTLSVGPDSTVRVSRYAVNEWIVVRGRLRAALKTPGRGRRVLKVATPTALTTIAGNEAVISVADDGATRVYALVGATKVRAGSPAEEVELAEHKMVEVSLESVAGAPADVTGDAVAAADQWRTGRNALVASGASGVLRKLAKRVQEDLGHVDAAFGTLRERRDKNREILKRSTEARAKRLDSVGAIQEELVQNSRTLVDAADLARSTALRILLREELVAAMKERAGPSANLGPAVAQLEGFAERIRAVQAETESQFRRFPRRERREPLPGQPRPGQGLPRLPPLRGATEAPRVPAPPAQSE